jgi:hypothetical protein
MIAEKVGWGGGGEDKRNINLAQIPKYWKSILPDGPTIKGGDVWNTLLTKSCSTDFAEFILQCTQSNQFKKVVLSYQQAHGNDKRKEVQRS